MSNRRDGQLPPIGAQPGLELRIVGPFPRDDTPRTLSRSVRRCPHRPGLRKTRFLPGIQVFDLGKTGRRDPSGQIQAETVGPNPTPEICAGAEFRERGPTPADFSPEPSLGPTLRDGSVSSGGPGLDRQSDQPCRAPEHYRSTLAAPSPSSARVFRAASA